MSDRYVLLRLCKTICLVLTLGVSMNADAGLFGFGDPSWKEEVLLHDGSKMVVERSQSYGGRHEIGQSAPIKEQTITFTLPNTSTTIEFKSEYGEDIGRANFELLALHILNGTPYIVTAAKFMPVVQQMGAPKPAVRVLPIRQQRMETHRVGRTPDRVQGHQFGRQFQRRGENPHGAVYRHRGACQETER